MIKRAGILTDVPQVAITTPRTALLDQVPVDEELGEECKWHTNREAHHHEAGQVSS